MLNEGRSRQCCMRPPMLERSSWKVDLQGRPGRFAWKLARKGDLEGWPWKVGLGRQAGLARLADQNRPSTIQNWPAIRKPVKNNEKIRKLENIMGKKVKVLKPLQSSSRTSINQSLTPKRPAPKHKPSPKRKPTPVLRGKPIKVKVTLDFEYLR